MCLHQALEGQKAAAVEFALHRQAQTARQADQIVQDVTRMLTDFKASAVGENMRLLMQPVPAFAYNALVPRPLVPPSAYLCQIVTADAVTVHCNCEQYSCPRAMVALQPFSTVIPSSRRALTPSTSNDHNVAAGCSDACLCR